MPQEYARPRDPLAGRSLRRWRGCNHLVLASPTTSWNDSSQKTGKVDVEKRRDRSPRSIEAMPT